MEMEILNTSIMGTMEPIMDLLGKYSNKPESRRKMLEELLVGDPYKPDISFSTKEEKGNNVKVMENFMTGMGMELTVDKEPEKNDVWEEIENKSPQELDEILAGLQEEANNRGYNDIPKMMQREIKDGNTSSIISEAKVNGKKLLSEDNEDD